MNDRIVARLLIALAFPDKKFDDFFIMDGDEIQILNETGEWEILGNLWGLEDKFREIGANHIAMKKEIEELRSRLDKVKKNLDNTNDLLDYHSAPYDVD